MKNYKLKLLLLICLFVSCMFIGVQPITISAESVTINENEINEDLEGDENTEPPQNNVQPVFKGYPITTSVVTDGNLYDNLLKIYSKYWFDKTGSEYVDSNLYSDMFNEFTSINLDNKNIYSLAGLEEFDLSNLISFSANSNKIKTIDSSYFDKTKNENFIELNLADNDITSFNISKLSGLKKINLSTNNLSSIDLSSIEGRVSNTEVSFNLANNNFNSISDIKLPSKRIGKINLNIINNNINDLDESYFTNLYSLNIGIQGFVSDEKVKTDTKNNLVIYKMNIDGLSIKITKVDGEQDEDMGVFSDSDITGKFLRLQLPVGEYKYEYLINGVDAYDKYDYTKSYLDSFKFNVIPQQLNVIYVHKNKEYKELGKVTGKVTVKLSSNDNGAEIYYSVNGGEWKKGTEIICDDGGNYSIKVKSVINNVESAEQGVWVRTSLNLYISDAVMLVLIVLLTLVLFLVVLPIVSKKYFKKD